MKTMALLVLVAVLSGCVGDNCWRPDGAGVNTPDCMNYRNTHPRPADPGYAWHEYILFPFFLVAVIADASSLQRNVVESPHYQAGGSAYIDYTRNPPQK